MGKTEPMEEPRAGRDATGGEPANAQRDADIWYNTVDRYRKRLNQNDELQFWVYRMLDREPLSRPAATALVHALRALGEGSKGARFGVF